MSGDMDKAREASRQRDLARKRDHSIPSRILGDSLHEGTASKARRKGGKVMCPDCPPSSMNSTRWDHTRELWICSQLCGFTETIEERKMRLAKTDD